MTTYVVDIETDGLVSSKIHVMSIGYKDESGEWKVRSTNDYDEMEDIMTNPDNIIIGHNFKGFDAVELERVLDIKVEAKVIDTLALAWYIFPERRQGTFGLEAFGEDYEIKKIKVDNEKWRGISKNKEDIINYYERFNK